VIDPLRPFIDAILEADRNAPRKQRHTAHRIYQRIRTELPDHPVAEVAVRQYVRERKQELGWSTREACVPQSYAPGQEGQVDWYEAWAELSGAPVKPRVFSLRSMVSGAAFHRAYQRATQQAFLEAHEQAFHYFGGIFRLLRYDNLKSAVKKILQGHRREETTRFIAFRSHWRFASDFCNPRELHEKGGIEGEAGYFRRNHWVPLPQARDLDDLNAQLLAACHGDERRQIAGHAHARAARAAGGGRSNLGGRRHSRQPDQRPALSRLCRARRMEPRESLAIEVAFPLAASASRECWSACARCGGCRA
jgi:transposase